jgi:hypothetical protein
VNKAVEMPKNCAHGFPDFIRRLGPEQRAHPFSQRRPSVMFPSIVPVLNV